MRDLAVQLGEDKIPLRATMEAIENLVETVCDPLVMQQYASKEAACLAAGIPYEPPVRFGFKEVVNTLMIGANAAGGRYTFNAMADKVLEAGLSEAKSAAFAYFASIILGPKKDVGKELEKADKVLANLGAADEEEPAEKE